MTDKPTKPGWQAAASREVKGRDLSWRTAEGIAVQPLYTVEDVAGIDPCVLGGLPGFAPFLRGPYTSMYTGRPWTIRQYAVSRPRRRATPSTAAISRAGKRASRSPSTLPPDLFQAVPELTEKL